MTVTDRLSKMKHYIPAKSTTAKAVARMFLRYVWSLHGVPEHIISDRGPQFVSEFWSELCSQLLTERRLSSAFHPETDGQSENTNQAMEQYLRAFVNYAQDDWVDWLPLAEFAHNNHISASIGVTPFYANYGMHLRGIPCAIRNDRVDATAGPRKIEQLQARNFASRMLELYKLLRRELGRTLIS